MKGGRKKEADPFSKTDWHDGSLARLAYDSSYVIKNIGKSEVTRTQGSKTASDGLEGRVFKVSFAELQNDKVAFRKYKVITEDARSKNCLTTSMARLLPWTKCIPWSKSADHD